MKVYYHSSPVSGLEKLLPKVSAHGKSYVYATDKRVISLIFGAKHHDFLLEIFTKDGLPYIVECGENLFDKIFKNKCCSIYTLEDSGFEHKTSWSAEVVSPNVTNIIKEEKIDDIYSALYEYINSGELVFIKYCNEKSFQEQLKKYITEKIEDYFPNDEIYNIPPEIYDLHKDVIENMIKKIKKIENN